MCSTYVLSAFLSDCKNAGCGSGNALLRVTAGIMLTLLPQYALRANV